jgi:hypothetical protein
VAAMLVDAVGPRKGSDMGDEQHPSWCDRASCSAYAVLDKQYHRSAPVIIATEDPGVRIYPHRGANADGTGEYVELAELEEPVLDPWYESAPPNGRGVELNMDLDTAPC